ncbi:MAG: hypothetical protein ACXABY_32450 [Candidatus Thorarchaeota archaeon]|jgi:hypothetical protein
MPLVTANRDIVTAQGPIKVEYLEFLTDQNLNDGDTFNCTIQNPSFAFAVMASETANTVGVNISFSGKVGTINSADLDGGGTFALHIMVLGF